MKILIIGSCRNTVGEDKSADRITLVEAVGKRLAQEGHELISGGAGGLQGYAASAYKKNGGKQWTVFYAKDEESDERAKPLDGTIPDGEIFTDFDYPMRDVSYLKECDGIIAFNGKLATFVEITHAVINYDRKIFQLDMGENIERLQREEKLLKNVFIGNNLDKGFDFLTQD